MRRGKATQTAKPCLSLKKQKKQIHINMKTKTINQLNSIIERHFQMYDAISENDYRKKYYKFRPYPFDPIKKYKEQIHEWPMTNFILSTLAKGAEAAGYNSNYFYKCINTEIHGKKIYYSFGKDRKGYYLQIHNSDIFALKKNEYIRIRSNDTPENFNPDKYLLWHIEKQLYKDGIFRQLQILCNINKEQAKKQYKEYFNRIKQEISKPLSNSEKIEIEEKALKKRLLKKKNIELDSYSIFKTSSMYKALNKTRYKHRVTAIPEPSIFDIIEEAHSLYDTDDEILNYCEEQIQTEPKTIWI